MVNIKTYQDLTALGDNEAARMGFILEAIGEHKSSFAYKTASLAEQYYRGLNPKIMHYQKVLYDLRGKAHADAWSANHKIASNFFNFAVTQENQYLLGNGAMFGKGDTKQRLSGGEKEMHSNRYEFDSQLQKAGKEALIGGVSFGFWNYDHLDVFSLTEFVPLYDEMDGALKAGIRWWQVAEDKPLRATLYEIDGYTDYVAQNGSEIKSADDGGKRPYIIKRRGDAKDVADKTEVFEGDNYPTFPIVPLYGNDKKQSELVGRQGTLDAFDLLNSNLVNNVDEGNYIYWAITNCGGMDDEDDQKFIERMKTVHVAHVDGDGSGGAKVEAHTVETPFQASDTAISTIKTRLYEDFQCLNVADLSAAAKTATEIRAAYQPLDSKADMYEYCVIDFVQKILAIAGIEDEVSFKRSKIINQSEEINMILSAAEYLDDATVTEQLCFILGLGEQADEIIKRKRNEETERFAPESEEDEVSVNGDN